MTWKINQSQKKLLESTGRNISIQFRRIWKTQFMKIKPIAKKEDIPDEQTKQE